MKTSEYLTIGSTYTREQLRELFNIKDATIYTGVFQQAGHSSIWLFVTEHKTPDRTQYSDFLEGDVLYWDGQTSGRTDDKIIHHLENGNELLLFYRKRKYECLHAAFRYEGPFEYASHTGRRPSHFVLVRAKAVQDIVPDLSSLEDEEKEFVEGGRRQRFTN